MTDFKIDKGVPMPASKGGPHRRGSRYPFADMEIGDSFAVEVRNGVLPGKFAANIVAGGKNWLRVRGITDRKFTSRVLPDGTVRVWLVAVDE